jgi:DNA-binding IclR family transcriptional regulator
VTDRRVLERQLEQIRRTRIAHSAQEHRLSVSSIAMPIVDKPARWRRWACWHH